MFFFKQATAYSCEEINLTGAGRSLRYWALGKDLSLFVCLDVFVYEHTAYPMGPFA